MAAVASAYGITCKSNQVFNSNSADPDTCDVGLMTCKTVATKTTCATCWPGWYLSAADLCVECAEEFAYSGCKLDGGNVVADDAAKTDCQSGFTTDSNSVFCIPCLGENVADCTVDTGVTIADDFTACM